MSAAACAGIDTDRIFYPQRGASSRLARAVCAECEVRAECLDYALTNGEMFGIWGGLSERQRVKLRSSRHREESGATMIHVADDTLEALPTPNGSVPVGSGSVAVAADRRCRTCGSPLKRHQATFCSDPCRRQGLKEKVHNGALASASRRARKANDVGNGATPNNAPGQLAQVLTAMFDAGAEVEVEVAGVRILARR